MAERFMTVAMVDDNMADCMQYNRDLVLFAKLRNVSLFSKCQDFEESSELYLLLRIYYYAFFITTLFSHPSCFDSIDDMVGYPFPQLYTFLPITAIM